MRSVIDVYLAKRDSPDDEAYATLPLPASPYAILDALERVRPDGPDDVDLAVEECHGFEYLAPYILSQPDLYDLNALAEKLSELNEYEATAFHGLVRMEADKKDGKLSVRWLLDLAYSTDCCHVVADVQNGGRQRFHLHELPHRFQKLILAESPVIFLVTLALQFLNVLFELLLLLIVPLGHLHKAVIRQLARWIAQANQ